MTPDELSAGNPRIRHAAKLRMKKFRRATGCILIEGARLVADALDAGADVRELFATRDFLDSPGGKSVLGSDAAPGVTPVTAAAANKLSETRTPQGVFAVVRVSLPELADVPLGGTTRSPVRTGEHLPAAAVLLADGIADPGNLGTMIRSAAALGADCVVASGRSADVLSPKCVRATMGAIFRVPVVAGVRLADAMDGLKSRGLRIVAAVARDGRPPWEVDWRGPTALLIGSEADGLPKEAMDTADERITLPMSGGMESLNAAAGAAALLAEMARQRSEERYGR